MKMKWNRACTRYDFYTIPIYYPFLFPIDDPTVQGLDKARHLQTGEMIIIVVVLLMWAGEKLLSPLRKCAESVNEHKIVVGRHAYLEKLCLRTSRNYLINYYHRETERERVRESKLELEHIVICHGSVNGYKFFT